MTKICECVTIDGAHVPHEVSKRRAKKRQSTRVRFWIRGRRLWRARKPRSVTHHDWSKGVQVVVHHTADPGPRRSDVRAYLRGIQNFHMNTRGWADIAYNFLIDPDGRVWEGRGFGVVGAHAEGYNTRSIGVCFMGTFTDDGPTPAAIAAYGKLLARLRSKGARIHGDVGHGDVYPTTCPGRGVREALDL